MAIKKYHVSENLFNPEAKRYHMGKGSNNRIGSVSNGAMFYIEATPNVQYSIKVYTEDATFVRLYLSNAPIVENVGESYNVISESETTTNPTVTIINTNYQYLWIQVGGTWYTEHGGTSIMLNVGSTALPYEPYGDSFKDWFYREYGTETETFTTLPKTIIGDGQPISSYTIKGNMQQSGTPTPSNPIYPTDCGEKTANLFDGTLIGGYFTAATFTTSGDEDVFKSIKVYLSAGTYTFSWGKNVNVVRLIIDGNYSVAGGTNISSYTITSTTDGYVGISFRDTTSGTTVWDNTTPIMLNAGSTAKPYEPFGYKIPISLNNVTYPIYISEPLRKSLDGSNLYDTIESNGTLTRRVDANGDALATPTTEQVTVPTLTTTGTAEQYNVLTTLAPSEVSLTYHGWHEHSDTKYTTP